LADQQGLAIYLVGGVVRDLLLHRENWDLDVTVEGDGIAFARLVADRYGAGLALFEKFATGRLVFSDGIKLDVASARRESYAAPAALPEVAPASIQDDLYRRDFTINAMAVPLNGPDRGRLLDPYGGRRDLKARTIRVLHEKSFIDDPTRIFRAIRFLQRFGFALEPETARLLKRAAETDQIARLSGPRLCNEILSLLEERDLHKPIEQLMRFKLLRFLHPQLFYGNKARNVIASLPRALAWWTRQRLSTPIERPLLYLMGVLSQSSEAVIQAVGERLQLSSAQARAIHWSGKETDRVARLLMARSALKPSQVYRRLQGMPDEALVLVAAKALARSKRVFADRVSGRLAHFVKRGRGTATRITGGDLKKLGLSPGPQFKKILDRLLNQRLDGIVRTKSDEEASVRRMVGRRLAAR